MPRNLARIEFLVSLLVIMMVAIPLSFFPLEKTRSWVMPGASLSPLSFI